MYPWIWRHLPFGLAGKIIGSLLLVSASAALLWYVVFPAVEPYMPFNDGQVSTPENGGGPGGPGPGPGPAGVNPGDPPPPPPDVIPYPTDSNNPEPTQSR